MGRIRANIRVNGIVQGVGFRPFIHKEIGIWHLTGWIRNNSQGVELEVEGEEASVEQFVAGIPERCPALAVVESVTWEKLDGLVRYTDFRIIPSRTLSERRTLLSPDTCVCEDCLRELFDPSDRRYRYPFINCTNCGPRFTIIRDVPYDRPKTTMAPFSMCPSCAKEYAEIADRRYHAQPNCCPDCGPRLSYRDAEGREVPGDALQNAVDALTAGKIVAVKGLGGFHLACRYDDAALVETLRRRKHRDAKPFALMCADVEAARRICEVSPSEERQLLSRQRPIVLLRKRERGTLAHISENGWIGVMLPYTPLHYLLLRGGPDTLVMTSANLSDLPILYKNEDALSRLRGIADGFLLHDREIETRCDDSLLWCVEDEPYFVRRSRGYVPYPLTLTREYEDILAVGAEQKASFTLCKGRYAFQSQHIGDLKNIETLAECEKQIAHFEHMFDIAPRAVACDRHPDYLSTRYAEERAARENIALLRVQHHHAHMASCMADNGLEGECIGVVWDGTGYGMDGTVWGGEFLTGGYTRFSRAGTIRALPLPGGDKAAAEPWRLGAALLLDAGIDPAERYEARSAARVQTMLRAGLNCPESSSIGRLFDGVSSILGITDQASYEGQGAVRLEAAAVDTDRVFPYAIDASDGLRRFDHREMIRALWAEARAGVPAGELAAGFMNTLADMAAEMCRAIREETGLDRVVLSGGSFQNIYVLTRLMPRLRRDGFAVFRHRRVSANDEGISLGQCIIACRGGEEYVPCHTAASDEDRRA